MSLCGNDLNLSDLNLFFFFKSPNFYLVGTYSIEGLRGGEKKSKIFL